MMIILIPDKARGCYNDDIDSWKGWRMIIFMCLCVHLLVQVQLALWYGNYIYLYIHSDRLKDIMMIYYTRQGRKMIMMIYLARPEDYYIMITIVMMMIL